MATQSPDKICLFDLDNTLADYNGAIRARLEKMRAPEETDAYDESCPHIASRIDSIKSQPGFWRNLEPLEVGFRLYTMARNIGFELHILTKGPSSRPTAWSEKLEWCRRHCPDAKVTVTENKALIYGRVLVDDHMPYVNAWLAHRPRGLALVPGLKRHNTEAGIFGVTALNFQAIRVKLQEQFDRK